MSLKRFSLLILTVILIFGCAQPNEPSKDSGRLNIKRHFPTGGYARDFTLSDEIIFIAEDQQGFSIYNYVSGTMLCRRDTIANRNFENVMHLTGSIFRDLLFVYDTFSTNSINVFDASDLQNPVFITPISGDTGNVEEMRTSLGSSAGIDMYWTSNNELKTGTFDGFWSSGLSVAFPNDVAGFDYNEEIFAVAGMQYGIHLVEKASGNVIDTIETTGEALDVKIVDNYLITALRQDGFAIYDISDQADPQHIITENVGDLIYTVDVEADYLILASHAGGVIAYDISRISDPELVGMINSNKIDYTYKAEIHEGEIFASTRSGIYIIAIDE